MIDIVTEWAWRRKRKFLVRLCVFLGEGKIHDWLLDYLYPNNMEITFKE